MLRLFPSSYLPCCATNADGAEPSVPVNLVIVGSGEDFLRILIRSGWDETASGTQPTSSKQLVSIDAAHGYRYQYVSPLFYYGRTQDASFRKIRTEGPGEMFCGFGFHPCALRESRFGLAR